MGWGPGDQGASPRQQGRGAELSLFLSRRGGGGTRLHVSDLDSWRTEMGQEGRAFRPGLLKGLQSHHSPSCSRV